MLVKKIIRAAKCLNSLKFKFQTYRNGKKFFENFILIRTEVDEF